jgi:hypothetical protein
MILRKKFPENGPGMKTEPQDFGNLNVKRHLIPDKPLTVYSQGKSGLTRHGCNVIGLALIPI